MHKVDPGTGSGSEQLLSNLQYVIDLVRWVFEDLVSAFFFPRIFTFSLPAVTVRRGGPLHGGLWLGVVVCGMGTFPRYSIIDRSLFTWSRAFRP